MAKEDTTRTLYRPVGLYEMVKILDSGGKSFPPRRPEQTIFYPVLNSEYAKQIARDWNTKDANSGYAGFVTAFQIDKQYVEQFETHTVGAKTHQELWIPSEQLDEFNQHIQGRIEIKAAFYGENFKGAKHWYKDWYADEMLLLLINLDSPTDMAGEISANHTAIQLNFRYWVEHEIAGIDTARKNKFLSLLAHTWPQMLPNFPLFGSELIEAANPTDRTE